MFNPSKITVTDICDILTVNSRQGDYTTISNRQSYGFSFCSSGRIIYELDNETTVSDNGCAVFLPKGQSYSISRITDGLFPVINFQSSDLDCKRIVSFPIENPIFYMHSFEKIKALSLVEENRAKVMSIFYDMLYQLSKENTDKSTISPAIAYLSEHYSNPNITNAFLADKCNISEVYFRKLFNKTYRTSPKQYLIDIRINRARQLLAEGHLKSGAVAEECGFSNPYHFCRLFKEKTGMTPIQYQQQCLLLKL